MLTEIYDNPLRIYHMKYLRNTVGIDNYPAIDDTTSLVQEIVQMKSVKPNTFIDWQSLRKIITIADRDNGTPHGIWNIDYR